MFKVVYGIIAQYHVLSQRKVNARADVFDLACKDGRWTLRIL